MVESDAARKAVTGQVWDEFCDNLKEVGKLILRPETPPDAFNRALGFRGLAGFLRAGLETALDYANPQYPAFCRVADETKKMLNDNPDNYYQNCVIDGRFDYRITGTRGTVNWFSIGSKGSSTEVTGMVDTGNIDSRDMTFKPDDTFEILVSSEKKPGNWLPMKPTSRMVIVRQTFGDRSKEKIAELKIECLNPTAPNNNLTPEGLEMGLRHAVGFAKNIVNLTVDWQERYKQNHLNRLPEDDQAACQAAGGDPNIHYYQSYWKLKDDEAFYVHLDDIPECQTWNLQLSNYWMQSMDYRFFRASVNKYTAHYEPDGSVKIVISNQDPGPRYPNWIPTLGHGEGGMLGRYVGSKNPPKEMKSKVVKFASL